MKLYFLLITTIVCGLGCTPKPTLEQAKSNPVESPSQKIENTEKTKLVSKREVASGKIDPNPTPPVPSHLICDAGDECIVVTGECGLNRLGNKTERKTMEAQFAKNAKEMKADKKRGCPKTKPILRSVGCIEKSCAMWPYEANSFAAKSCSSVNDCTVVKGICGKYEIVHTEKAVDAAKTYAKANSIKDCAPSTEPKPSARCEQNVCVPVLTQSVLDRLHPVGKGKPTRKTF